MGGWTAPGTHLGCSVWPGTLHAGCKEPDTGELEAFQSVEKGRETSARPTFSTCCPWGLVGYSIAQGDFRLAAVLALGFHACLRTGESARS